MTASRLFTMRTFASSLAILLGIGMTLPVAAAQTVTRTVAPTPIEPASAPPSGLPGVPMSPAAPRASGDTERRMQDIAEALARTQRTLEQSVMEVQHLRAELQALQAATAGSAPPLPAPKLSTGETLTSAVSGVSMSAYDPISDAISGQSASTQFLAEEQDAIQAEIQQHEQTKIETTSKYPLKITGLVLFNGFTNRGRIDNLDLPTLALSPEAGVPNGSSGASVRQTVLGFEAIGPHIAGARSAASLSMDFFGDLSYSVYTAPSGTPRLRRARIALDWTRTTVQAGVDEPLISPRSPTSYATVAQPALSWAGNLWTWSPQLRVEQRITLGARALHLEAGLLDPLPAAVSASQVARVVSPAEQARQPAFETRVSLHSSERDNAFIVGVGGFSSHQAYTGTPGVASWAATADWLLPLSRRLELSGEAYRGQAIAALGGGAYKNVLTGIDPRTGLVATRGLDAVGGWSQLKVRPLSSLEANLSLGLDDALAGNFRRLILTPTGNPLQFYARNRMLVGNLVFRPRAYLIVSPEYRRIWSWETTDHAYTADVYTLSFGYSF